MSEESARKVEHQGGVMNVKDARAALEEIVANSTLGGAVMAAADACVKAAKLGVIDEILSEGYSPEQIEHTRRNIEEGVE